jgi:hypothetical protein
MEQAIQSPLNSSFMIVDLSEFSLNAPDEINESLLIEEVGVKEKIKSGQGEEVGRSKRTKSKRQISILMPSTGRSLG